MQCSECQSCSKQARVNGKTVSVSVWCLWWCLWSWCVCVRCGVARSKRHPVCTFKTSPCVPAPRAHVETHVRVVPVYTGDVLKYTWGRFGRTHGVSQRVTHTHTPNTTPTQRDTERDRERARKKTERRKEKRRREEGGRIEHEKQKNMKPLWKVKEQRE